MRRFCVAFGLVLAAFIGIVSHAALADESAPAIVHLAMRDHLVTISASPDGPRYSIRDRSGNLLSADLTDRELLASYPQLHRRINSGYAGEDSGSFVWAGRDEALIEPPVDSVVEPPVD